MTVRPDECLGKEVFTHDGESLGMVLDVTLFSFSRVKQLLVETETGMRRIGEDLIERVEPERILLRDARPVNE